MYTVVREGIPDGGRPQVKIQLRTTHILTSTGIVQIPALQQQVPLAEYLSILGRITVKRQTGGCAHHGTGARTVGLVHHTEPCLIGFCTSAPGALQVQEDTSPQRAGLFTEEEVLR